MPPVSSIVILIRPASFFVSRCKYYKIKTGFCKPVFRIMRLFAREMLFWTVIIGVSFEDICHYRYFAIFQNRFSHKN